jgi:hypothetical protein
MSYTSALWDDATLANPCRDDMIAYNLAYAYSEFGDEKSGAKYYKISSAQDAGPEASRFLAVLSEAREGDHTSAAEKFLLIAVS